VTKQAKAASSGARGPRGSYAKTAEVRQKILDACVEAFGAGGFHGATMKDIAERAGISQTGLLHHFGSKAELLVEVLAAHERETAAIVREADDLDVLQTQLRVVHANKARPEFCRGSRQRQHFRGPLRRFWGSVAEFSVYGFDGPIGGPRDGSAGD
jgi:AcrR family transcriptional regulator